MFRTAAFMPATINIKPVFLASQHSFAAYLGNQGDIYHVAVLPLQLGSLSRIRRQTFHKTRPVDPTIVSHRIKMLGLVTNRVIKRQIIYWLTNLYNNRPSQDFLMPGPGPGTQSRATERAGTAPRPGLRVAIPSGDLLKPSFLSLSIFFSSTHHLLRRSLPSTASCLITWVRCALTTRFSEVQGFKSQPTSTGLLLWPKQNGKRKRETGRERLVCFALR